MATATLDEELDTQAADAQAQKSKKGPSNVRIWNYGIHSFESGQEEVDRQMDLAFDYRNDLAKIEADRIEALTAAQLTIFPDYAGVCTEIDEIDELLWQVNEEMKRHRAHTRKKSVPAELRARAKALKDRRSPLYERRKAVQTQIRGKLREASQGKRHKVRRKTGSVTPQAVWEIPPDLNWVRVRDEVNREFDLKRTELYNAEKYQDLAWGNKLAANTAVPARNPRPPKKKHYDGSGRFVVQLQGGLDTREVFGRRDGRLRLTPVDWLAPEKQRKSICSIRTGSVEGTKAPIFAKARTLLHRPLPQGRIKWAWIKRLKFGTVKRYWLQVVVACDEPPVRKNPNIGRCGVNVNFRRLERGVRVAVATDDEGRTRVPIIIPEDRVQQWLSVRDLRSARDHAFNQARQLLVDFLRDNATTVPDWLKERTATLSAWRKISRLAGLVLYWRGNRRRNFEDHRFPGDSEVFDALEAWRKADKKEYDRERHVERNFLNWRKNFYIHQIQALPFSEAAVGTVNYARMQKKKAPIDEQPDDKQVPVRYRNCAAPGLFTQILQVYLKSKVVDVAQVTATCHECGELCEWEREQIIHTCESCGATWDQDVNAAINLAVRGSV